MKRKAIWILLLLCIFTFCGCRVKDEDPFQKARDMGIEVEGSKKTIYIGGDTEE